MKSTLNFAFFIAILAVWIAQATALTGAENDISDGKVGDQQPFSMFRQVGIPNNLMCPESNYLDFIRCTCHMIKRKIVWFTSDFPTGSDLKDFVDGCTRDLGVTAATSKTLCEPFIKKGKLPCKKTANKLKKLSKDCLGNALVVNKKSKKKFC